jgi:hypothetical protein
LFQVQHVPYRYSRFRISTKHNSHQGRRWFFAITAPSDDYIGELLSARKENTLRWLCCYKTVEDQKFLYLQGGLIFKQHTYNKTWLNLHLWSPSTLLLINGYENEVVQHCAEDFNQGKDRINLINDEGLRKRFIPIKIPEEYGALTQLLTEDKITIYEICENYPHIYETYYKVLERITF